MSMRNNAWWAMEHVGDEKPMTIVHNNCRSCFLCKQAIIVSKVDEIALVMIIGSVEDNGTFSTLVFTKPPIMNNMKQTFGETIPFDDAFNQRCQIKERFTLLAQ